MDKSYFVYKHTCKFNGKSYIGVTTDIKRRWNNGSGYRSNKEFEKDIIRYGWEEGFIHEILCITQSRKKGFKKEKEFIKKYESDNPEKGYNKNGFKREKYKYVYTNLYKCHINELNEICDKEKLTIDEYINNFLINELKLNDFERSIRYANRDILKERTIRIRFKISTELFKKLENKTKEVGRRSISNLMEFLIIRELEQRKDDK